MKTKKRVVRWTTNQRKQLINEIFKNLGDVVEPITEKNKRRLRLPTLMIQAQEKLFHSDFWRTKESISSSYEQSALVKELNKLIVARAKAAMVEQVNVPSSSQLLSLAKIKLNENTNANLVSEESPFDLITRGISMLVDQQISEKLPSTKCASCPEIVSMNKTIAGIEQICEELMTTVESLCLNREAALTRSQAKKPRIVIFGVFKKNQSELLAGYSQRFNMKIEESYNGNLQFDKYDKVFFITSRCRHPDFWSAKSAIGDKLVLVDGHLSELKHALNKYVQELDQ